MPLRFPTPASDIEEQVRNGVHTVSRAPGSRTPHLRGGPELTYPHQVFHLDLETLTANPELSAARAVGWRYLVNVGGQIVASAETAQVDPAGPQVFSQVNYGPFVASTERAINTLASSAIAEQDDLDARLLLVPALNAVALWAHGTNRDALLPLAPTPSDLDASRVYTPQEFMSALAPRGRVIAGMSGSSSA